MYSILYKYLPNILLKGCFKLINSEKTYVAVLVQWVEYFIWMKYSSKWTIRRLQSLKVKIGDTCYINIHLNGKF